MSLHRSYHPGAGHNMSSRGLSRPVLGARGCQPSRTPPACLGLSRSSSIYSSRSRGGGHRSRRSVQVHVVADQVKGEAFPGVSRWLDEEEPAVVENTLSSWTRSFMQFWLERRRLAAEGKQKTNDQPSDLPAFLQSSPHGEALVTELEKYGEMVTAAYDSMQTKDVSSQFFGGCADGVLVPGHKLREYSITAGGACRSAEEESRRILTVSEAAGEYKVVKQMEADSGAYRLIAKEGRNFVGFIAQGPEDADGAVDIAIVFRGTVTKDDWIQDAKALQVRWAEGFQISQPPNITLSSPPFQGGFKAAAATFLGALVTMNLLQRQLPEGGAASCWLLTAVGGLLKFLSHLVGGGDDPLSLAQVAAVIAWAVAATLKGIAAKPQDWVNNVTALLRASWAWTKFGIMTFFSSLFCPRTDSLLSWGFKEMYCDANFQAEELQDQEGIVADREAPVPPSPRLTIYRTLVQLLQDKVKIRSITVTGHSLGGALAAVCGYDLSLTVEQAVNADKPDFLQIKERQNPLFELTARERAEFMSLIWQRHHKSAQSSPKRSSSAAAAAAADHAHHEDDCPSVGVVSFAAPRVGNMDFARAFKGRSLEDPLAVAEPLEGLPLYEPGASWLGLFVRDRLPQLLKVPLFWAGLRQLDSKKTLQGNNHKAAMLRVVNTHDVVPQVPFTIPIRPFRYIHGGYELLLNSYLVPYVQTDPYTGESVVTRHNMEVYLHMINPRRDIDLINKGDRSLRKELRVPAAWWSPIPNNGMKYDAETRKWEPPK